MTTTRDLGRVVMTPGIRDAIEADALFSEYVLSCLRRHGRGDCGEMDPYDVAVNSHAWIAGLRVLSAYTDPRFPSRGVACLWIITEADRASTCILFPDEY